MTMGASAEPSVVSAVGSSFANVSVISPFLITICSASGFVAKKPAAILSYGGCTLTSVSGAGCWKL